MAMTAVDWGEGESQQQPRSAAAAATSSGVTSFTNTAAPMPRMRGMRCSPSRAFVVSFSPCSFRHLASAYKLKFSFYYAQGDKAQHLDKY